MYIRFVIIIDLSVVFDSELRCTNGRFSVLNKIIVKTHKKMGLFAHHLFFKHRFTYFVVIQKQATV